MNFNPTIYTLETFIVYHGAFKGVLVNTKMTNVNQPFDPQTCGVTGLTFYPSFEIVVEFLDAAAQLDSDFHLGGWYMCMRSRTFQFTVNDNHWRDTRIEPLLWSMCSPVDTDRSSVAGQGSTSHAYRYAVIAFDPVTAIWIMDCDGVVIYLMFPVVGSYAYDAIMTRRHSRVVLQRAVKEWLRRRDDALARIYDQEGHCTPPSGLVGISMEMGLV